MGIAAARLVFLAFFGLTGLIIYNALYLQDLRGAGGRAPSASSYPAVTASAPAAAPVRTDVPGNSMQTVSPDQLLKAVQRELTALGYVVGRADGEMDATTRDAISAYQKSQDLPVTGLPSDDLLRRILLGDSIADSDSTGALSAAGPAPEQDGTVKSVQQVLAELGYSPGPIDGAMGGTTARAIKAFQHDRKITETGRITPELLAELKQVTGRDLAQLATQ